MTVHSDSLLRDGFIEGAARAFFVIAYADYVEDEEREDDPLLDPQNGYARPGPGEDWMDYAPENTPGHAYALAGELWALLEVNDGSVYSIAQDAAFADGGKEVDPDEFGHSFAMEAMGHGVSWFDSHATFTVAIPHIECSMFSFDPAAYRED